MIGSFKLTAIVAGIALLAGAFGGWRVRDSFCDAAAAREALKAEQARTATLQADLDIAKRAADQAREHARAIEEEAEEDRKRIEDYAATLAARDGCALTDNDLERLRNIGAGSRR